jgi:acyl carrier protein
MSPPPRDPTGSRADELEIIASRIAIIVSDITRLDAPLPDEELINSNIDSVTRLEMLARVEQEFEIELTEDLLTEFKTINHIARLVRGALAPSTHGRD